MFKITNWRIDEAVEEGRYYPYHQKFKIGDHVLWKDGFLYEQIIIQILQGANYNNIGDFYIQVEEWGG